jgi:hypothetical protein
MGLWSVEILSPPGVATQYHDASAGKTPCHVIVHPLGESWERDDERVIETAWEIIGGGWGEDSDDDKSEESNEKYRKETDIGESQEFNQRIAKSSLQSKKLDRAMCANDNIDSNCGVLHNFASSI